MPLQSHLLRREGTYHFRIRVPRDLVSRFGRRELKISLRTKIPAVARTRGVLANQCSIQLFELVRLDRTMSAARINELARSHFAGLLEEDRQERKNLGGVAGYDVLRALPRAANLLETSKALATRDFHEILPRVENALLESGIDVDPKSQDFEHACEMFLRAKRAAQWIQMERDEGRYFSEADDHAFRMGSPLQTVSHLPAGVGVNNILITTEAEAEALDLTAEALIPLSEYVKIVVKTLGHDGKSAKAQTAPSSEDEAAGRKTSESKYLAAARALIEIAGDKPIYAYRKPDIVKLKNMLMKAPRNAWTTGGSIQQAIADNARSPNPKPTLNINTINNSYLTCIRQIFKHADGNAAILKDITANVKAEYNKNDKRDAVDLRHPFIIPELNIIYASPLYAGAESRHYWHSAGKHFVGGYRFWLPLFMTFGGFRPHELGQAEVGDICEVGGYPCLQVTNQKNDKEDQVGATPEFLRKLKSAAAQRTIPIHPVLLALGFLNYIEGLGKNYKGRLFPDWKAGKSDGTYSALPAKDFNGKDRFLERLGLKTPEKVLYSLRHTFKDRLRIGVFEDSEQDYFMGHANPHVSRQYGSTEIFTPLIDKFLKHVHYDELDLSKIIDKKGARAIRPERLGNAVQRRLQKLGVDLGSYLGSE